MIVVDHQGVVRGSNDAAQVNQKYVAAAGDARVVEGSRRDGAEPRASPTAAQVLDFAAPVLFQGKTIGKVHLGIYEAPLTAVANLVLVLLAILTLVTVAAVAGGTYLLAQRLAAPIRVLRIRSTSSPTGATTTGSPRRARTSSASSTPSSTRPPPRSRSATRRLRPQPRRSHRQRTSAHASRCARSRSGAGARRLRDAAAARRPTPPPAPCPSRRRMPGPVVARDERLRHRRPCAPATRSPRSPSATSATPARRGGSRNSTTSPRCAPGRSSSIPLRLRNPVGVYANGYQTIPILCYHRFGSARQQAHRDARGVRAADGLPRAQRLHRDLADAPRALPRGQGGAAGEDRWRSRSTTATARRTRSPIRS